MAWKTPAALARIALLAAMTFVLASCGGGNTAEPAAPVATTPSSTVATGSAPDSRSAATATAPVAPPARATTPAPRRAAPPANRSRPPGGAAAPSEPSGGGSLADAPAATGEPSSGEAVPDRGPAETLLDERARLVLTRRVTNTHYFQQGTVTGTYDGTMEVEARITSKGVLVRFTATLPGGTISGRGVAVAILDSTTWPGLRGRAIVTGGTGRFAGIRGRGLRVTGRAKPDASRARVRLAGMVRF